MKNSLFTNLAGHSRLVGVLAVGLALCAGRASAAPIHVGYSYWLPNVPLDVAETKGWFKEAGLEIELQRYDTTQAVQADLQAAKLDVATDMIGTWLDQINRGEPLVVLGETDWSHGGDKLVIKQGIDLAQAKGLPVAVYIRNLALLEFVGEYLRSCHRTLSDFQIVELSDDAKVTEAFESGRIPALVYYEPLVNELVTKGHGRVVATTADFPGVMPEGFVARRAWRDAADHAALVKFFQVWFRAVAYSVDPAHAAEVAQLATEKTFNKTQTIATDELAGQLSRVPMHSPGDAIKENSAEGNLEQYRKKAVVMLRLLGQANPKVDLGAAIDPRALLEAAAATGGDGPAAKVAAR